MDIQNMTTEARNPDTWNLDEMAPLEIVTAMNREDAKVAEVVAGVLPQVARAVAAVEEAFRSGGRLFYMGAGTSGRLGVLDASECPPTFGVPDTLVIGLIAGGDTALRSAVEGAEDNEALGRADLLAHALTRRDVVVGVAASGRTPYVQGGLEYARELGCQTVAIACNRGSEIGRAADIVIEAEVGPEVLTGSTRLKSGTAQKMILNMLTTAAMVRTGKAYQNLMIDLRQSNEKLVLRAQNITMEATGCTRAEATRALAETDGQVKKAVLMLLLDCGAAKAETLLAQAGGHIRRALHLAK